MHWCANIVCGPVGVATAVLLRAGEVVEGLETARERRPPAQRDRDLARGPARLASALAIGPDDNGADLCTPGSGLRLRPARSQVDPETIRRGPRVGVSGVGGDGVAFPWRLWLDGDPTVSSYKAAKPRRRAAG
jgi:DNA-3-methyladenine glycosylase